MLLKKVPMNVTIKNNFIGTLMIPDDIDIAIEGTNGSILINVKMK